MNRIHFAALALVLSGTAQASEITQFPTEPSVRARADVRAEARTSQRVQPGELYDGRQADRPAPATMKSREQVRLEARADRLDAAQRNDRVGGM